jgi:hypothetical protein
LWENIATSGTIAMHANRRHERSFMTEVPATDDTPNDAKQGKEGSGAKGASQP